MTAKSDFLRYLDLFSAKHIAVVGDLMLDMYHRGSVSRISPEAPVPVVSIDEIDTHAGGAANVALNLNELGAEVSLYGVIGEDPNGEDLLTILENNSLDASGILSCSDRPTTTKTRVIAGSQHVVRTDLESTAPISESVSTKLVSQFERELAQYDAVILQDYNKGVLVPRVIREIIDHARDAGTLVTVDPKLAHFGEYVEAFLIKPNWSELESLAGERLPTIEAVREAGTRIVSEYSLNHLVVTIGDQGMLVFGRKAVPQHIPTEVKQVADVSGAGDTVIATITLAITASATVKEAATMGNIAAGLVCENIGIVPVTRTMLEQRITERSQ